MTLRRLLLWSSCFVLQNHMYYNLKCSIRKGLIKKLYMKELLEITSLTYGYNMERVDEGFVPSYLKLI